MRTRPATVLLLAALAVPAGGLACRTGDRGAAPFSYAGATLRIIVGHRVGGPYDVHARLLARYLGKHVPGHPDVIVENMPGASGAIARKFLATQTRADGLTIGLLTEVNASDLIESDLLGHFDLIGGPGPPPQIVLFSRRSGIADVDTWRRARERPRFGANGTTAPPYVAPLVASAALALPMQMVTGYASTAETRLALDSGEIDAVSVSMDAYETAFQSADVRPVLRFSAQPIPKLDAPDAMTLASDDRARELLETGIYLMAPMVRFYVTPRGVPADRLALLRESLMAAFADPELLAAARTAGLTVDPTSAGQLQTIVTTITSRPAVIGRLRSILKPR